MSAIWQQENSGNAWSLSVADPNAEMLRRVAEAMANLDISVVYVGGATIALYLDPYAASQVRTTLDVDCVVPTSTQIAHQRLEEQLRKLGFRHCQDDDAPICRWNYEDLTVDIMSFDDSVLGFANRFSRLGFESAMNRELAPGCLIKTLTPRYFFASKVEAYETRGVQAPYESKDLEDLVLMLDGAPGLESEIEAETDEVRTYIAQWAALFLRDSRARDLLDGHLPRGPLSEERIARVLGRLQRLAAPLPQT